MHVRVYTDLATILLTMAGFFGMGVGVGISLTLLVQLGAKRNEN